MAADPPIPYRFPWTALTSRGIFFGYEEEMFPSEGGAWREGIFGSKKKDIMFPWSQLDNLTAWECDQPICTTRRKKILHKTHRYFTR